MDLTKLYQKQISLTEWFEGIEHENLEELRREDYDKRERLKVLNEVIGLPFDRPTQFTAQELNGKSSRFLAFLQEHGDEICALRLNPLDKTLPKHRLRGPSVKEAWEWFKKLNIDISQYKADFVPHAERYLWSTIFIVNEKGIFGEIVEGGHYQLTQGFHDHEPLLFIFDFEKVEIFPHNEDALNHIKDLIQKLQVTDTAKREKLVQLLNASFSHDYLEGYFETVYSADQGLWFCDYNRLLGRTFENFIVPKLNSDSEISGVPAFGGKVTGKVRIVTKDFSTVFEERDILVCEMTTPDFLPLVRKAGAIITEQGGILSHAAIVSRELKIPCLTRVKNAMTVLKEGDFVEVDADEGVIRKL